MPLYKLKKIVSKILSPITIMLIPHGKTKVLGIKIPIFLLAFFLFIWSGLSIYIFSLAVKTLDYYRMKHEVSYLKSQFNELKHTIIALKNSEEEFKRLFSFKSKKEIFENIDFYPSGDINLEDLKIKADKAINSVTEVKKFLLEQQDIYRSTPLGWPLKGNITSFFGTREHPKSGNEDFHTGIDISASAGTEVRATADGIVIFSGYSGQNGNVVMLRHGYGFTTVYAHNQKNLVTVGQRVKRGDVIALSGNTGSTTGPHLHYEIWHNNKPINPLAYLKEEM